MFCAVEIDANFGRLAWPDVTQFRFTEVGLDPQVVQRDDRHEIRARFDPIADLRLAFGDITGDRRADLLPRIFEMRVDVFVLRQLDRGMLHDRGAADLGVERVVFGLCFPYLGLECLELIQRVLKNLFRNRAAGEAFR